MSIPLKDTPSLALIERGLGGPGTNASAVRDCMQLLNISKRTLAHFFDNFTEHDISPGKYSVLCELLEASEPVAPSVLAEKIGVSRPVITGLIEKLHKQGYVERRIDESDRRGIYITLTRKGTGFIKRFLPHQFSLMTEFIQALNEDERSVLRQLLTKLEKTL